MIVGWLFTVLRLLVTLLYVGGIYLSLLTGREVQFAFSVAAFTVAYGILMTVLWLYEWYPARQRQRQ
jgi:hypothetical protein